MIFLGGTSGFHYGQVVLQIHLSVGQEDFLTKFDPCTCSMYIVKTRRSKLKYNFKIKLVYTILYIFYINARNCNAMQHTCVLATII